MPFDRGYTSNRGRCPLLLQPPPRAWRARERPEKWKPKITISRLRKVRALPRQPLPNGARPARCAAAEVIGNAINIEPQYKDGTTEVTNVSHILYGEWNGKYSLGLVAEEN